jgi:hypothetical protein
MDTEMSRPHSTRRVASIGRSLALGIGFALLLLSRPAASQQPMRVQLIIYPYQGIELEPEKVRQASEALQNYLRDRIRVLYSNFAREPLAKYMRDLTVEPRQPKPGTPGEYFEAWGKPGVLALFDGVVSKAPAEGYMIRSSIFLGDLGVNSPGNQSIDLVSVDMPLRVSEFGRIADTHSVVTLLGLALDARQAGLPWAFYVKVASKALETLDNFDPDQKKDPQIKKLKCAAVAVIAEATKSQNAVCP